MANSTQTSTLTDSLQGSVESSAESLLPGRYGLDGARASYSFSARTCLELLRSNKLSDAQLDTEIKHLKSLYPELKLRDSLPAACKHDALQNHLTDSLCEEVDKIVNNFSTLLGYISRSVDKSSDHVTQQQESTVHPEVTAQTIPVDSNSSHGISAKPVCPFPVVLPEPVCLMRDIDLSELSIDTILKEFNVCDRIGNRFTTYFGHSAYSYGKIKHEPADYPTCAIFDLIFDKIHAVDNSFTRDDYTCLITYYPTGMSSIPPHSDNESVIAENSLIYTLSVGATRVINFTNTIGPIQDIKLELQHGSVFTMSQESQSYWEHNIPRDPAVDQPRVSFTFRRMLHARPEPRPQPRPISEPRPASLPQEKRGTHKRVLLLADSITASTPTYLFDDSTHKCIKKVNFELVDMFTYEPEFNHTDVVIISAGVNDLSRGQHTAQSLADSVCPRLSECSKRNIGTTFVFNSLLLTQPSMFRNPWDLNREIDSFNKTMFDMSLTHRNILFFDSDHVLRDASVHKVIDPQGNGIHITLEAKRAISRGLVKAVARISAIKTGSRVMVPRGWTWPLRASFTNISRSQRARVKCYNGT